MTYAGINLGCGEWYAEGWLNVDLPTCPHRKDLVGDVLDGLPLVSSKFRRAYCGHVLEHIHPSELRTFLFEVQRLLTVNGELLVVGPAIERTLDNPEIAMGVIDGGERWDGDRHAWVPTARTTLEACVSVFPRAQLVFPNDDSVSLDTVARGYPLVSSAPWQCAVLCPCGR